MLKVNEQEESYIMKDSKTMKKIEKGFVKFLQIL